MSFEYDVESAVREAIRRGGHADYSYRRPSRRQASIGIPLPRLIDAGADLAIVVELSATAAQVYVEEAREAVGRALRQDTVRSLAVIGPEGWANWANEHWETRPFGTLEAEHLEAAHGEGLALLGEFEREPSAIVVITDHDLVWPKDLDSTNLVLIAIPRRVDEERLADEVADPPVPTLHTVRGLSP